MKLFIYFSDMIGMDILDAKGQWVGHLHDLGLNIQGDIYPKVTDLIIRRGFGRKEYVRVAWEELAYIEEEARLKLTADQLTYQRQPIRLDFTLRRDILDQQVVDIDNQKVERVNDIHLLRVENQLYAAHVDVGLRAIVRRLGWTWAIDLIVRLFNSKSAYLTHEDLISWKDTQILPKLGRMKSVLKLDVSKNKLSNLSPAALAELMQDLDIFARMSLFKSLEANQQHKVFADMNLSFKVELIEQLEDPEIAQLIINIPSDEAADLLLKLPRAKTSQLMQLVGSETGKKLSKLLKFTKDSAGGLMTTEYLTIGKEATVADAIQKIKDNVSFHGGISFIYILDENQKYLGTTTLRHFISKDPSTPLIDTCYKENVYVYTDDAFEEVALLLERHKISAIPVLNHDEVMQGVITIDDVLEELIALVWVKYKEKL